MQIRLRLALVAGMATFGAGASIVPAFAACAALPAGAPVVSPGDLLGRFPAGGGGLVSEVRNMVATNPNSVDGLSGILAGATTAQKEAIGAGLGQAAGLCARQEPASARRIQEAVLAMNSKDLVQAFQTVTGDRQTAATGGGGGGGGAGGGGGGGGGTGVANPSASGGSSPFVPASTTTVANQALTFSAGSAVSAGLAPTRNLTGTTSTANPASAISAAASPVTNASPNQ